MNITLEYSTHEERELLINEHADKHLIEESILKVGNFLVFTPHPPLNIELEKLKNNDESMSDYLLDIEERLLMFELTVS